MINRSPVPKQTDHKSFGSIRERRNAVTNDRSLVISPIQDEPQFSSDEEEIISIDEVDIRPVDDLIYDFIKEARDKTINHEYDDRRSRLLLRLDDDRFMSSGFLFARALMLDFTRMQNIPWTPPGYDIDISDEDRYYEAVGDAVMIIRKKQVLQPYQIRELVGHMSTRLSFRNFAAEFAVTMFTDSPNSGNLIHYFSYLIILALYLTRRYRKDYLLETVGVVTDVMDYLIEKYPKQGEEEALPLFFEAAHIFKVIREKKCYY